MVIRSRIIYNLVFGFADASGKGFGSCVHTSNWITIRTSVWGKDLDDKQSSNWKEFCKAVEALEKEASVENLKYAVIFLNTDNSTTESYFYKGSLSSEKLHLLVTKLKAQEVKGECKLHVAHVAGAHMIEQGLSRGLGEQAVSSVVSIMSFLPYEKSALSISPKLWTESVGQDMIWMYWMWKIAL